MDGLPLTRYLNAASLPVIVRNCAGLVAQRSRPTMPLASGTKLGPYAILAPLGAGGMGEVYRARDTRLEREVAIKILPASFAQDADRLRRFKQEAHAIAALNHPNILAIHDIGNSDSSHYIVTELLEGESLHARLRIGPLPLRKALEIAIQAVRGVAAAHDKGIVHRDLKPANLFITEDGRMKILDFGLAKLASKEEANLSKCLTLTQAEVFETEPGLVLGTVGYMSPEQVRGKPADARSDIFALVGNVIYTSERWLDFVRISPRGDHIAFVAYSTGAGDIGRIVMLDRKGKLAARSAQDFGSIEGVAWSPDGDEVWFGGTIEQSWANSIYAMTSSGEQRVVLRLPGVTRLYDVSRDGKVLLSKDIWRTEMEFRGAKDTSARSLSWFDCSVLTAISSAGDQVAFYECGEAASASYLAFVRKTDGSPAVKLGDGYSPVFSPDGKSVLVRLLSPARLELLPTGTGEAKQLDIRGMQEFSSLGWMPNGNEIYFAGDDGHNWRLYAKNLAKGDIRPLTPSILMDAVSLADGLVSPNGKYCFSRDPSGVGWLYPLQRGEAKAVKGLLPEDKWIGWASDGLSAFVYQDKKTFALLFQLDLTSGSRKPIAKAAPQDPSGLAGITSVRITPDGKSYAYSYNRSTSDLFIVEGVH